MVLDGAEDNDTNQKHPHACGCYEGKTHSNIFLIVEALSIYFLQLFPK